MRSMAPGDWYLMTLDLAGDPAPPSLLGIQVSYFGGGEFSPDGRWIAYAVSDGSAREICARPYPGPGPKVRISIAGGSFPRWSPHGDEIFYRCEEAICAAPVELLGPRLSVGPPSRLVESDLFTTREANFTVSPDGRRFFMVGYASEDTAPLHLVYVPNWTAEVKQTVSAGAS